jgi:hypothetical protein
VVGKDHIGLSDLLIVIVIEKATRIGNCCHFKTNGKLFSIQSFLRIKNNKSKAFELYKVKVEKRNVIAQYNLGL